MSDPKSILDLAISSKPWNNLHEVITGPVIADIFGKTSDAFGSLGAWDPSSGAFLPAAFVATGRTFARTPMDRAADLASVKDWGVGTGAAGSDAAIVQNILNAGTGQGFAFIPAGTTFNADLSGLTPRASGSMLWLMGGVATFVNGFFGQPPGTVVNTIYNGDSKVPWISGALGIGNLIDVTPPDGVDQPTLRLRRDVRFDGGTVQQHPNLRVQTQVGNPDGSTQNVSSHELAVVITMDINSPQQVTPTPQVGLFVQTNLNASSLGSRHLAFGTNFVVQDLTQVRSSVGAPRGLVNTEFDVIASGADDAYNRRGIDLLCRETLSPTDGTSTGVWLGQMIRAGYSKLDQSGGPVSIGLAYYATAAGLNGEIRNGFVCDGASVAAFNGSSNVVTLSLSQSALAGAMNLRTNPSGTPGNNIQIGGGTFGTSKGQQAFQTDQADINRLNAGMLVSGLNIPAGTYVGAALSGNTVPLVDASGNPVTIATLIPSGTPITFTQQHANGAVFYGTYTASIWDAISQYGQEIKLLNGVSVGSPVGGRMGVGSLNTTSFFINGNPLGSVRVITADPVTLTGAEETLLINKGTGSATAITLPTPTSGRNFYVKDAKNDAATNNITLTPSSGTIDGGATYVINTNRGFVRLVGDGAAWNVIGKG